MTLRLTYLASFLSLLAFSLLTGCSSVRIQTVDYCHDQEGDTVVNRDNPRCHALYEPREGMKSTDRTDNETTTITDAP